MVKVTYKGSSMLMDFAYICTECKNTCTIEHRRSDDMSNRTCPEKECGAKLSRHITGVPMLDADYHQDQLARNIGWSR